MVMDLGLKPGMDNCIDRYLHDYHRDNRLSSDGEADQNKERKERENQMVTDLTRYQRDCVDAFRMEFSKEDIKQYPEVKKLARSINKQGRKIDKINRLKSKLL